MNINKLKLLVEANPRLLLNRDFMSPLIMKYKYGQILPLFKNTSVLSILLVGNEDRLRLAKRGKGSGIDMIDFKSLPIEKKVEYIRLVASMDIGDDFDYSLIINHDDFDFASYCSYVESEVDRCNNFDLSKVKPNDALYAILEFTNFQESFCKVSYIIMSTMIKNGHNEWRSLAKVICNISEVTARRLEKLAENISNRLVGTPAMDLITGYVDSYIYGLSDIDCTMEDAKLKLINGESFRFGLGMFKDHRQFWICCKTLDTNKYILTHRNQGMGNSSYSTPYKVSNSNLDDFIRDATSYIRGVVKIELYKNASK
ncbi:MAG: hypothetical protein ACRC92_26720 [Peptostreptococcaceae bacterium]